MFSEGAFASSVVVAEAALISPLALSFAPFFLFFFVFLAAG
jgi:hypothetical protein